MGHSSVEKMVRYYHDKEYGETLLRQNICFHFRDKSRDGKHAERWETLTNVCADSDTCRTFIALPDVSDGVVIDRMGTIQQRSGKRLSNRKRQNDRTKTGHRPGNDLYVDRSDPEIRYSRDDQQLHDSTQNSQHRSTVSVLNLVSRQESKSVVNERTQHLSRHSFELSTCSGHDDVTVVEVHSHGLHAYKKSAATERGTVDRRVERMANHDMFSQTLPETRSCFTSTSYGKDVQADMTRAAARPSAVNQQSNVGGRPIFRQDSDLPINDCNGNSEKHENSHELEQAGVATGICYTSMADGDRNKERAYNEFAAGIGEGATEGDDRRHPDVDWTRSSVSTTIANTETQYRDERAHPSAPMALNRCVDRQPDDANTWTKACRSMVRRFMSPLDAETAQKEMSPVLLPNATITVGGGSVQIIHPRNRSQKPPQKEDPMMQHTNLDQHERQIQQPLNTWIQQPLNTCLLTKLPQQHQHAHIDQHEWLAQETPDKQQQQLPQQHRKQCLQPTQQQVPSNQHDQHQQRQVECSTSVANNTSPMTTAATASEADVVLECKPPIETTEAIRNNRTPDILTTSMSRDAALPEQNGIDDSKIMNVHRVIYEDIQNIMSAPNNTNSSDESAAEESEICLGKSSTDIDSKPGIMSANSISRTRNGDDETNDIQSAPIISRFGSSPLDSDQPVVENRPNDPLSAAFIKVVDGFRETKGRIKLIRQRWDKTDELVSSKCESSRVDAKPEKSVSFSYPDQPTIILNRQDRRCEHSCGKHAPSNVADVLATTYLTTTFPGECSQPQSVIKLLRPQSITAASKQRLDQPVQLANEQQLGSAPVTTKQLLQSPPLIDEQWPESVPVATDQPTRAMPIIRNNHPGSMPDVNEQQLDVATVIEKQRSESAHPCNEHDLEAITTRVERLCQLWEDINVTNSMDNKVTPPHWQKALQYASAGLQENAAVAKAAQSRGDSNDGVGDLTTPHQKWLGWTECQRRRLVRPADTRSSSDSTRPQPRDSRMAKSIANSLVRMHSPSTSRAKSSGDDCQALEAIASIEAAEIDATDQSDASAGAALSCRQLRLSPAKSEPSPDRRRRPVDQRTAVRPATIRKNCTDEKNSRDNTSSIGVRIPAKEESEYRSITPLNSRSIDNKSRHRTSPLRSQTNDELTSVVQKRLSFPANQKSATIRHDSLNASSVDSGNHSHDYVDSMEDEGMRQSTYRTLRKVTVCRPLHPTIQQKGGSAKTMNVGNVRRAGQKLDILNTKQNCSPPRNRLRDGVSQEINTCARGRSRAKAVSHSTQGLGRKPPFTKSDQSVRRPSCVDKHFPHQKTLLDGGQTCQSETQSDSCSTIRDTAQDTQREKSQVDVGNIDERQTSADSQCKSHVELDDEENYHRHDTFEISLPPSDNINGELYDVGSSTGDKGKRQSPVPFSPDSSSGEPVHRRSSWHKHRRKRSRARKSSKDVYINQSTTDTTTDDRSNDRMAPPVSQDMKFHSRKPYSKRTHKKRGKNNTSQSPVLSPKSDERSTTVGESMEENFDSNPWLPTTSAGKNKNISLNARKPPNTGYIFQSVYANETRLDYKHSQTDRNCDPSDELCQRPLVARRRRSSPILHVLPLGQTSSEGELRLRRVQSHPQTHTAPGFGRPRSPTSGDKRSLNVVRKRVSAINGRFQLSPCVDADRPPGEVEPNVLSSFAKVLDEIRNHPICLRYAESRERTVGASVSTDRVTLHSNNGSVRRNPMPHTTTKKSTRNVDGAVCSDIVQDTKDHPLFKVATVAEAVERESLGGRFNHASRSAREMPESTTTPPVAPSTEQLRTPTDTLADLQAHPLFHERRAIHKADRSRAAANPRSSVSPGAPARTRRPSDVATRESSPRESLEDAYDIAAKILLDEIDGPTLNIRERLPTFATVTCNSERRLIRGDTTSRRLGVERAPTASGRGMQISRQKPTRRPTALRKKTCEGQGRDRTLSIPRATRQVDGQSRCRALPTRRVVAPPLGSSQSVQPVVVDAAELHSSRRLKVYETTYIV